MIFNINFRLTRFNQIVYLKILSRAKPAVGPGSQAASKQKEKKHELPRFEEYIEQRDYTGAATLLETRSVPGMNPDDYEPWIAYCAFHLGDFKKAMECYEKITKRNSINPEVWLWLACTYFMLGMYPDADDASKKAPKSKLLNRLLFHLSHKFNDEKRLMSYHQNLQDITEDQLSLASIHYLRSHYQEAIDIYKRILLENRYTFNSSIFITMLQSLMLYFRDYLALNAYVALCYYKLDYHDVSQVKTLIKF